MGQECQKQLNTILLYIYDDGSIEKKCLLNKILFKKKAGISQLLYKFKFWS